MVKDAERRTGTIKTLASCIKDTRHQSFVGHSLEEMAAKRVYPIVDGYEDAIDGNTLREHTILKMSVGRLLMTGKPLASQPTLTRFGNTPKASELYSIAYAFAGKYSAIIAAAMVIVLSPKELQATIIDTVQ